ncbi:glycoside hydrolase family 27 protein [Seonamhaeicola sp.]|uniref:glycoside hydrolase family 27 protein n=1 Tax=Seonamhaeicola sp. TaxID=1912245 RepID=UPI00261A9F10|nr:glycoside hydrolase family 27 protein [Seonamhaeicola sp.]
MYKKVFAVLLTFQLSFTFLSAQIKPEISETPPMGWNSWNWYGKQAINEAVVKKVIDDMAKSGLRDAGYIYVIIDGGWRATELGENGALLPHPVKFPKGIKPLADYAHLKGMKLGVHVVPGTHDCGGDPVGGYGYEEVHVQQFVNWGLDFIKLDKCTFKNKDCENCPRPENGGWSEVQVENAYKKWSRLLNNCGRDILFSISAYEYRDWYPDVCNMARTTYDIRARIHKGGADFVKPKRYEKPHLSVMEIAEQNNEVAKFAGNGYWNDPDMLVTGVQGLSSDEQVSHFALWCIMSSPLMLGNDPGHMDKFEKDLLLNKEMIAVNQDPTEQGTIIKREGKTQVWAKKLRGGKYALLFLNLDNTKQRDISINLEDLGFKTKVKVRNIIDRKNLGVFENTISMKVKTHESRMIVIGAI